MRFIDKAYIIHHMPFFTVIAWAIVCGLSYIIYPSGSDQVAYPGDEDPDPELENRVFKIMTAFWPDMTITEFSELREEKGFLKLKVEDSGSDYYGNYSTSASVSADFKELYKFAHR